MENDKLKSLFADFNPELSSDFQFISKLERNLDSVELIKRHTADLRARNRKALVFAAAVGFIVGFLFSLTLPYLCSAVNAWQMTLPYHTVLSTLLANNISVIAWSAVGCASVFTALNTYEISLSLLTRRE